MLSRRLSGAITLALASTHYVNAEVSDSNVEQVRVVAQYLAVNESNSVKTPTPILDVPQSLSIINAEEISNRNISSIEQLTLYTPGVNSSQGEGHRDAVVFRGVRSTADFFLDGARDDVQYYRPLYNIEQVEILRGPNALLFGRGGTGGILNRVTKSAKTDKGFTNYKATANSFGGYRAELDSNVVTDESSAVRFNAMYEELKNHRDFYDGQRIGLNPTAHVDFSTSSSIDLSYEYLNHDRFIDRGIPTGADGRPVDELNEIVFGDPENNFNEVEAHIFRLRGEHGFSENTKLNFSLKHGDYDKVYANLYASGYDSETNIVSLDGYIDATERQNTIASANLISEFQTGNIGHTLIVGAEHILTNSDQNRFNTLFDTTNDDVERFTAERPLSINNFVGTNAAGDATRFAYSDPNDDTRVDLVVSSVFVQDEIALSKYLDIVLGARFDSFDIEVLNALNDERRSRLDQEVSPRAGIILKPKENISFYTSYSESFLPRSGEQFTDINGDKNRLDPDTYSNTELGLKWDLEYGLSLTTAIFENTQKSPVVSDDDASTLDIIESEISGFEFQLAGHILPQWQVTANYAYLEGETGTGSTPRELPEHTFSIWNAIQATDRLGFSIGASYQDESFINNANTAVLPSYTRVDAAAYYQLPGDYRIQLNLENITDTTYYPYSHSTHQASVGAPFNASLSISGSF